MTVAPTPPYRTQPYVLDRETAPAFWLVATLWMPMATCHQTANRFSLIEQWMPTGLGPPTHRHPRANEGFYVLDGTVAFNADGRTVRAGPGTFIHLPRLLPHSFSVDTEEAHVLNFYAPAGFEMLVMSAARPAEERRRPTIEESAPPSPDQIRILSRLFGQEEVEALPFCQPTEEWMMRTSPGAERVGELKVARAAEITARSAFGLDWRILADAADTDETYELEEVAVSPGRGVPARMSEHAEAIYVLEGSLDVAINHEVRGAVEGSLVYCPAGTTFGWTSRSGARALSFRLPGQAHAHTSVGTLELGGPLAS